MKLFRFWWFTTTCSPIDFFSSQIQIKTKTKCGNKIRAFLKNLFMHIGGNLWWCFYLVTLHSAFVVVWMCEQKKSNGETVFGISSESKRTAVNDFLINDFYFPLAYFTFWWKIQTSKNDRKDFRIGKKW